MKKDTYKWEQQRKNKLWKEMGDKRIYLNVSTVISLLPASTTVLLMVVTFAIMFVIYFKNIYFYGAPGIMFNVYFILFYTLLLFFVWFFFLYFGCCCCCWFVFSLLISMGIFIIMMPLFFDICINILWMHITF